MGDAENNTVGVVGVAQDVTEAAKHDRAVAVMANELRQLIDTANAPIFGIDVDGDVNEWNEKTAEITGFSKEEAFDKPLVSTFIVPSLRQSVQDVLDNALKGRGTSNYELEFRTKSKEIRYLLVNATTRRDAENNIVGVVGVAQDVTEAAKHDRAVAAMANELRQLVDTANAPIFGIDVHGNVNEWNDKPPTSLPAPSPLPAAITLVLSARLTLIASLLVGCDALKAHEAHWRFRDQLELILLNPWGIYDGL